MEVLKEAVLTMSVVNICTKICIHVSGWGDLIEFKLILAGFWISEWAGQINDRFGVEVALIKAGGWEPSEKERKEY